MSQIGRLLPVSASITTFLIASSLCPAADRASGRVGFDMDTIRHQSTIAGPEKLPTGTVEGVPSRFGSACRFRFKEDARSALSCSLGARLAPCGHAPVAKTVAEGMARQASSLTARST